MVAAIVKEIDIRRDYLSDKTLNSIYFGGGTPSLLEKDDLLKIFGAIHGHFKVSENAEITLEANPDDLNESKLTELGDVGVNRLSIGVQSFFEDELLWMNRAHNAKEAESCIKMAQDRGFENITIDMIFGLPQSDHAMWVQNIEKAVSMKVPHISAYALTVEEGTALHHFVKVEKVKKAEDEHVMKQFDITHDILTANGFNHYEISNYAIPGHEAVHNSNYWKTKVYLGIGPSAHSYNLVSRASNVAHNHKYIKAIEEGGLFSETEMLDIDTRFNEYVMTRIRTIWGIKKKEVREFGTSYLEHLEEEVKELLQRGWVSEDEDGYMLTREGMHYADAAAAALFI